jgi:hypothetical protein
LQDVWVLYIGPDQQRNLVDGEAYWDMLQVTEGLPPGALVYLHVQRWKLAAAGEWAVPFVCRAQHCICMMSSCSSN